MAKKFIKKAIKHPGAERKAAKKAGESTHEYMEEHKHDPGKAGKRARLGLTLEGMHGGKMGKPVHHSENTEHRVEHDSKGKEHHVVEHHVHTRYEYPRKPQTPMDSMLARRGY